MQPQLCEALDGVPLGAVAAGLAHTVCVSRDGAVYACGWNCNGQLGTAKPVVAAAAGAAEAGGGCVGAADGTTTAPGLECVSSLRPVLVEHPALEQEHVTQVSFVWRWVESLSWQTASLSQPVVWCCAAGVLWSASHSGPDRIWSRICMGMEQIRPVLQCWCRRATACKSATATTNLCSSHVRACRPLAQLHYCVTADETCV